MPFLPASRTKRNLVKIASLGLAGLLAGLLAGCTDSQDASATAPYTRLAGDSFNSESAATARPSRLPANRDAIAIPALKHPPSARRLQYGSVHTVSQTSTSNGRYGY